MNFQCIFVVITLLSCGKSEEVHSRIYNGNPVKHGSQNHLVKIFDEKNGMCSGSIISRTWVLTAAHCVYTGNMTLVYHHSQPTKPIASIYRSYPHPQFHRDPHATWIDPHEIDKDIALVKTSPINFNQYIKPINLMKRSPRVKDIASIAGYGDTNSGPVTTTPLQGKVTILKCPMGFEETTVLCTYNLVGVGDGDSGGSITTDAGLAGVISGSNCINGNEICSSVAANVADKLTWINSVLKLKMFAKKKKDGSKKKKVFNFGPTGQ